MTEILTSYKLYDDILCSFRTPMLISCLRVNATHDYEEENGPNLHLNSRDP